MALDIGDTRVGIATSDAHAKLALPLKVLNLHEVLDLAPSFKRLIEDYEPEFLVVGLPMSLSGQQGQQAKHIQAIAQDISQKTKLSIEYVDERLSSKEAKRILREQGLDEKSMRGKIDMVAASLFLQAWLDSKAGM